MSYAARREAAGAKGLLGGIARGIGIFTAPQWMPAIFNQGQQSSALTQGVNRAAGVVPGLRSNPQTDVGRRLGNEIMYAGRQLASGRMPYAPTPDRQIGQQAVLGGRPVYWGGKGYGWRQLSGGGTSTTLNTLNAPGVQNRFIQDEDYGVYGGTSPAADRAYRQEVSRVAQLTAQDPELQRYEAARKLAVAPGATQQQVQAAEDIGMQIWRDKYGATPMGRPGGAVGSFNPLMQRTFGYQTGMSPQETQAMQATAAPVPVAPGEVPYQQGDLGTRATLETGYDPSQYGLSPNLVEDMKKRLLQQAGK